MTIHDFDMARYVTGSEVVEVFARGARARRPGVRRGRRRRHRGGHARARQRLPDDDRQLAARRSTATTSASRCSARTGMAASENPLAHTGIVRTAQRHARAGAAVLLPRALRAQLPARVGGVRRARSRDGRDAAGRRRRRARAAGDRPGRLALAARGAPGRVDEIDGGRHGRERSVRRPAPRRQGASSSPAAPRGSAPRSRAGPRGSAPRASSSAGASAERGERGARRARGLGCEAVFVAADLADEAQCRAIVRACEERFGRLDGLVNAAGLSSRGTLDDTSVELWDRLFAVNARAPFLLMQEAARLMRRAGGGGSSSTSSRWPATAASRC